MKSTIISVTGVNHATAPISVRELLALSGERLHNVLRAARHYAEECVIISTCNRLEVYALAGGGWDPVSLFDDVLGDELDLLSTQSYSYEDDHAVKHLFGVAAGLDSLVLGEVQILGQVQRSWQAAHAAGAAGPVLSQLFHKAVALGKRAHSETSLSRHPASVSYAAVTLAQQIFGPQLRDRRVLVIGTGEVGEGVARCLHDHGVSAWVVAHRQIERAQTVARRYEAHTVTWNELSASLAESDIVISSTSAPHYVLQRSQIDEAMRARDYRPIYLIDLALPRDIDPGVSAIAGVHLHNLDDLQAVVSTTIAERQSVVPEIEAMIEEEAARFAGWLRARSAAPLLSDLQAQARDITEREVAWALSKMPDLTERERQVMNAMASRITGKLLHGPIQWVKARAEAGPGPLLEQMEPDYGMSNLSHKELVALFYRTAEEEL